MIKSETGEGLVLYGAETWTMRKVERKKVDAFEMWCWRRVTRVSWIERTTIYGFSKTSSHNGHWNRGWPCSERAEWRMI